LAAYVYETILGDSGFLIRETHLGETYVLGLAFVVVMAAWLVARSQISGAALRRVFVALTLAELVGLVALAVTRFHVYQKITEEDHLIEWLSADFLLGAWLIGLVSTIRLARSGRPSPIGLFLTAGYFAAFWRELEWGQPFFGEKCWYSRNLWNLRAYVDPSYFDEFRQKLQMSGRPLYVCHLVISAIVILIAVFLTIYLIRHRRVFLEELRNLPRSRYGRYFLLGAGMYLFSQLLGAGFRDLLRSSWLADWRHRYGVSHRVLDEPLELWGAMCFLFSMIVLWKTTRAHPPSTDPKQHTKTTTKAI
jgi:hypothetical protein